MNNLTNIFAKISVFCFFLFYSAGTFSANYYWVNGTGNWSDFANHWATTSGGSFFYLSAPGQNDDVYFDMNSFPLPGAIVTVDVTASCRNMDWTGSLNSPDLGGSFGLEIYGSLKFIPGMTAGYNGSVSFLSPLPGQTVDFSSVSLFINMFRFEGAGEYTLLSDVIGPLGFSMFVISNGTLNTNDKTVITGQFSSWPMGNRVINLGNSIITCQMLQLMNPTSLTFNAGTSTINIQNSFLNGEGLTYYDINFDLLSPSEVNIMGANTFHTIGLNYSNVLGIVFPSNEMQTVFNITFGASCSFRKSIRSNISGEAAIIKKISGFVNEDFLNIKDISIIGGAVFTTNNGVNLGNVTNWNINPSLPGALYWVGGTGNWNDPDHWSAVSGGPYPSGNPCIPSDNDDVIFDNNSFSAPGQTVTLNTFAVCKNMNWSGVTNNPAFASVWPSELNIYGSLTLDPVMTYNVTNAVNFRADTPGKTITSAGKNLNSTLTFEGQGGWALQDNLTGGYFTLSKGNFSTNNFDMTVTSVAINNNPAKSLSLGNSTVNCNGWYVNNGTNLTLNQGTSQINNSFNFNGGGFTYNDVTLSGTGTTYVWGANTFNTLNYTGGSSLMFESGTTQTFSDFTANGSCSGLAKISSNTAGNMAFLSQSSGTVTINYASLKDITAGGGATFNANNSIDEGNVIGWNFGPLVSINYYWIGGTGNWNDPLHWSLVSGGAPNPGGCIPTQADNVFFNGSSGLLNQTVTVNVSAYCNNMSWAGVSNNATLAGTQNIYIFGSMTLAANMSLTHTGGYYFQSANPGNTINTAGKQIRGHVYFQGSGTWGLAAAINVGNSKNLYLNQGTFSTNNFNVTTNSFYSSTTNNRVLNLGSSTVNCTNWSFSNGTNLVINPGTSTINVSSYTMFYGGNATYNNVNINVASGISIYGSNTFNILNIPNCTSLRFEAATVTTFNTLSMPNGTNCNSYFVLSSTQTGNPAQFLKTAGAVNLDWMMITDIRAGGGATFNATNSQGIGDVTGWNIISPPSVDLYWIGGTGNWNDPLHWSLSTGGPSYGCIPTINDNVFFDANSFMLPGQIVTVNVPSSCKNMIWAGVANNPEIAGWSPLNINGSVTLSPNMILSYGGTFTLCSASPGNTIFTAGHELGGISISGDYSLSDNLNMNFGTITFNNGSFNTNNNDIISTSGSFVSNSANLRTLNLGSSLININTWQISNSTNFTLIPGTSLIVMVNNPWEFRGGSLNYNDVRIEASIFGGNTTIYGSNTFNSLMIENGANIRFEAGTTQNTSNFTANGNDGDYTSLMSSAAGSVATINQVIQGFCGDYLRIQDLTASGNTFYAGNNSIDLGNNSGWTWSGGVAIDQYPASMCEESPGTGTVSGINLTSWENAIDGGTGSTHTWFLDYELTQPVATPGNVTVTDGLMFFDAVDNGICTNIAEITFTVVPFPVLSVTETDATCYGLNNGAVDLNVSAGWAPYSFLWSSGQTTEDISSVAAGNYSVTVTDLYSCSSVANASVLQPAEIILSFNIQHVLCNGDLTGAVDLTVTGDAPPYSFEWSNTEITEDINNLAAGTYDVTVTDFTLCTATGSAIVTEPTPLTVTINTTNLSCWGQCDGSATVIPAGGTPPYTYSWSTGYTASTYTGLCAGVYTVTITDSNGCTKVEIATITQPPQLTVSTTQTNVLIYGQCTGTATANPAGGTPGYTYLWSNGSISNPVSNLCVGAYCVTVVDSNGCTALSCVTITQPAQLTVGVSTTDVSCNGACDGTAAITPSGGVPPYSYLYNPPIGDLNNICAGTYSVTVTDNNGATATAGFTISEPQLLVVSETVNDVSCYGLCDGSINIAVSGGTLPYSFSWTGPMGFSSALEDISALCPGSYNLTVTDANGCSETGSYTITEPPQLTVSTTQTDVLIYGQCTGTATAIPAGGVQPVTYSWCDGQNTQTANGLCAGSCCVTVTDLNGCTVTSCVTITQPAQLTVGVSTTDVSCNGACDGTAAINPSGGVPPYSYSLNPPIGDFNNICAGTYSVTVTDNNGATATTGFTISEPQLLVVSETVNDISCYGLCDGSIDIDIFGGTAAYMFSWTGPMGFTSSVEDISALCAGTYNLTVTDANGCTDVFSGTISEPPLLSVQVVSVTDLLCNNVCTGAISVSVTGGVSPYDVIWDNFETDSTITSLCAGTYSVSVTDFNGCQETAMAVVNEPPAYSVTASQSDATCGNSDGWAAVSVSGATPPYAYLWDDMLSQTTDTAVNLSAGIYVVQITDFNNCLTYDTIIVNNIGAPVLDSMIVADNLCYGQCDGSATIYVSGGTSPYTYIWSDGNTSQTASGLCSGTFTWTATDANACMVSGFVTILEPDSLSYSLSSTDDYGTGDGTATVIVSGGTPPYSFLWNDSLSQTTATAISLTSGWYTVTVTDDNGCFFTDSVEVILYVLVEPNAGNYHISLYPNPVADKLNLSVTGLSGNNLIVTIINSLNQIVFRDKIYTDNNVTKAEFDMNNCSSGFYYLIISGDNIIKKLKFVKSE